MFTVRDVNTGEFLFWVPETETFIFSRSRMTVKEDYETISQYIQCATEGYPEAVAGRALGIYDVGISFSPSAVYHV